VKPAATGKNRIVLLAIACVSTALVLLIVFKLISGSSPAEATTTEAIPESQTVYYVATDGSDDNPGTLDRPWQTIQKAADTAGPGDVIYVRGGTYNEQVTIMRSGQENAFVTFENYKDETPVISGAGLAPDEDDEKNALILIRDKSYIRIKGFEITDYSSDGESLV